jgi:hypothetical protein
MTSPHPELDRRLAALRDGAAAFDPPPAVDAAIAAAARSAARAAPRRPGGHAWIAWPFALAAAIALLSFVVRSLAPVHDAPADALPAAAHLQFTPVVPLADIEETGDALVVPARVPRMTLAQFGVPVDPARADDAVDAELLVRRDGALLAYRFVNHPQ